MADLAFTRLRENVERALFLGSQEEIAQTMLDLNAYMAEHSTANTVNWAAYWQERLRRARE